MLSEHATEPEEAPADPAPVVPADRRPLAALAFSFLVAAWSALPYLSSLDGDFLRWDDADGIVSNVHIQGLGWDHVQWAFTTFFMGHYQPLTWLSHAVDWSLWGLDPLGFRLTNLLLHVTVAVLLLFACRRLLASLAPQGDAFTSWLAPALGTLFFSLHPLRVESVAWITERRDVLCGVFLMAATLAYLRASSRGEGGAKMHVGWLAGSVALFGLSLLSKAAAIAFPVALVCLDLARARRIHWRSKIPFVALAVPFVLIAPLAQESTRAAIPFELLSVFDRLWIASYGLAFYLQKTLWPTGLSALHELPYPLGTRDERFVHALVVLAIAGLLLLVLWRLRPRWFRAVALTLVAGVAFLVPVLGFFQSGPQLVAGRYTYFAALPLSFLLTMAFARLLATRSRISVVAVLLLCLALLSAASDRMARTWRSENALWTRALKLDPRCALCNASFGHTLLDQGRLAEAEVHFKTGLRKLPTMTDSIWALVKIYRSQGRYDESLPYLDRLLRRHPEVEAGWQETARAYWHLGSTAALLDLLDEMPPEFAGRPWARAYSQALAALGGPYTPQPATPDELEAVARLLSETNRCVPSVRTASAPEWIRRVHDLCRLQPEL